MLTVTAAILSMHALCAALQGDPAAARVLRGVRRGNMLASLEGPAVPNPPIREAPGPCGGLQQLPCDTGCASDFNLGVNGLCVFEMPAVAGRGDKVKEGDGHTRDEAAGDSWGRALLRVLRNKPTPPTPSADRRVRDDSRGTRAQKRTRTSDPVRTRTRTRAPRRARPTDPVRTRNGKRAPRRARPSDPVRTRNGKRAPRRARPSDPVRTRNGKRAPRRARPSDLKRTRTGKRAPRRARSSATRRRTHTGKPAPRHGRNAKRSSPPPRRSSPPRAHNRNQHSPRPSGRGRRHSHVHHHHHHHSKHSGEGALSFEGHQEGHEGEGDSSTVYVKGDVGTVFVTSSGSGFISATPSLGSYGGHHGAPPLGSYGGHHHGAPNTVDHTPPPVIVVAQPHPPPVHHYQVLQM